MTLFLLYWFALSLGTSLLFGAMAHHGTREDHPD